MTRWTLLLLLLISACASPDPSQRVFLVRHAEKAVEPAGDPVLTEDGRARAVALAERLADEGIETVITTQFHRTVDTGAPFASSATITAQVIEAGRDNNHIVATANTVKAASSNVLVVGHSNTIPAIIAALGGPQLDDLDEREYDTLFVLTLDASGARLETEQYGANDGFN